MFFCSRRVERLYIAAGCQDELVVGYCEGIIAHACQVAHVWPTSDYPLLEIDALGFGFVVFHSCSVHSPYGFFCHAEVEEAACCAGEEWCVLDGADRRDDGDIVAVERDVLGYWEASPTCAYDCQALFGHDGGLTVHQARLEMR